MENESLCGQHFAEGFLFAVICSAAVLTHQLRNRAHSKGMPRALELFSGTGSVGKVLREHDGWEVVSVDCLQKFKPDICTDIGTWNYTADLTVGEFDYMHLSPPCTEYSRALTTRPRRLEEGDRLALKALEILDFLQPRFYTIENPDALLKTRPFIQPLSLNFRRWLIVSPHTTPAGPSP